VGARQRQLRFLDAEEQRSVESARPARLGRRPVEQFGDGVAHTQALDPILYGVHGVDVAP